jgi:hypothetical protein
MTNFFEVTARMLHMERDKRGHHTSPCARHILFSLPFVIDELDLSAVVKSYRRSGSAV